MENQTNKSTDPLIRYAGKPGTEADSKTSIPIIPRVVKICEPCLYDDTKEIATGFCVECVEYLCSNCSRDHRKNKLTREHKILNGEQMPSDPTQFTKMKQLMQCPEHTTELVFKCKDHDQFICVTCLAVGHRKCENVVELVKCSVDDKLRGKLETLRDNAVENKMSRRRNVEHLRSQQQNINKEQREFVEKVANQLRELNEKAKEETKRIVEKDCAELEDHIRKCDILEQEARFHLQFCIIAFRYGSTETSAVISSYLLHKAEELEKEIEKHSERHIQMLRFDKNSALEKIDKIGVVSFVKIPETEGGVGSHNVSLSSDEFQQGIMPSDGQLKTAECNTKTEKTIAKEPARKIASASFAHMLRTPHDTTSCVINGFAYLGRKPVAIDKANVKLKVFQEDCTFLSEKKLSTVPVSVCTVENNIAVINESVKLITVYQIIGNTLAKQQEFATRYYPRSIASFRGLEACVLFSAENIPSSAFKIELRNIQDGKVLQILALQNLTGEPSICCLHYTCKGKLVISQGNRYSIFMDTRYGVVKEWFYSSQSGTCLADISYITSDKEGNIYVCGAKSKDIQQVSGDNYADNAIIASGLPGSPTAVLFDNKTRCLTVALENEDRAWVIQFE